MTRLTEHEQQMLGYATQPTVSMERLEILHFLDYPEVLPTGTRARVLAVVERILENRGFQPI